MQIYEVTDYLGSIQYRNKDIKELSRMIAQIIAQVNSKKTILPTDIVKFPWDDDKQVVDVTTQDREQLAKRADEIKNRLWPT